MSAELDQLVKLLQSVLSDVAKRCLTSVISDRGSFERGSILGGLVSDKSNNHAVEVEEEHEQVKAKLEERFLLVNIELAEDLSRIEEMSVVDNLLDVPAKERQVENERDPVTVDEEEEGQETVHSSLGDDIGIESVAEVNGVNVITFQITVHDSEENL